MESKIGLLFELIIKLFLCGNLSQLKNFEMTQKKSNARSNNARKSAGGKKGESKKGGNKSSTKETADKGATAPVANKPASRPKAKSKQPQFTAFKNAPKDGTAAEVRQ